MSALPLFDIVLSFGSGKGQSDSGASARISRVGSELVRAAIAEFEQIEALDETMAPASPDDFDPHTAVLIRGMYDQWSRDADALLGRVATALSKGAQIEGADRLRDVVGRTMAMLSVSLEDIARGRRQFEEGRFHTIEE